MIFAQGRGLPDSEYFDEPQTKDLIVLHHTVGASAGSTLEAWKRDGRRVATAYIVERDGTVLECFPPECWACHVGLNGNRAIERRSIGIEIASDGPLIAHNGKFYAFGRVSSRSEYKGEVFDCSETFRSYRYFAAYTPEAMAAVCELVEHLLSLYSIPRQTPADHLSASAMYGSYRGVISHAQLRADKSDVHPGFDWAKLIPHCKLATTVEVRAATGS